MKTALLSIVCGLAATFFYDLFIAKYAPSIRTQFAQGQTRLSIWIKNKIFIGAIKRNSDSSELWMIGISCIAILIFLAGDIRSKQNHEKELLNQIRDSRLPEQRSGPEQSLQELEKSGDSLLAEASQLETILWAATVLLSLVWMPYALLRREAAFQIGRIMTRLAVVATREEFTSLLRRELAVENSKTLDIFIQEVNNLLNKYAV